ncbi:uridine kinase [Nakamurella flavida]|uniref:Uridine kinase n=1 Tax=Nakamurella flavida TaxID=363630 RepID=A0A938YDK5_9ACTN|nr:uridine kinase [Nakamurella flavida]MBM9475715.1 uridine kinase [Nakamurella flavida]MDP9778007.1 hypothetical protein [Nakamurella flavida]
MAGHPDRLRVGIDGLAEAGAGELADRLAEVLRTRGRGVVRVDTSWWWRSAALRLEYGRQDVDMLLDGWVDAGALRREVLDPLGPGGSGEHLTRLRDPAADRSVRESRRPSPAGTVLVLDGPFLLTGALPLDLTVHLAVSPGRVRRILPPDRDWWAEAVERYARTGPADRADLVVSYDHPGAPAVAGTP